MRVFSLAFLLLSVACHQSSIKGSSEAEKPQPGSTLKATQENHQLSCWGVGEIEIGDSYKDNVEKVGAESLSSDSLYLEGMFERLITVVWIGTAKEVRINWKEKEPPFSTIGYLEISNLASSYSFDNGIRIGITLKEMQRLNEGQPLNLYGFGWDYGGTFVDFGNGRLKGELPCFSGVFTLKSESVNADLAEVMGDHKISSDNPALENQNVRLSVIRIANSD